MNKKNKFKIQYNAHVHLDTVSEVILISLKNSCKQYPIKNVSCIEHVVVRMK